MKGTLSLFLLLVHPTDPDPRVNLNLKHHHDTRAGGTVTVSPSSSPRPVSRDQRDTVWQISTPGTSTGSHLLSSMLAETLPHYQTLGRGRCRCSTINWVMLRRKTSQTTQRISQIKLTKRKMIIMKMT